ncbi:LysR substrate-binding domain-containing protein [Agromyces sp. MMS24-K17]|uniref:LysR substrate-binding domain-containing protein n=1 Tax=Agromyces sp. MMS24-K17 TaxID=3372850 RepID=UPI0037552E92
MLAQAAAARDAVVRATHEPTGSLRVGAEQCLGFVDVVGLLERAHRRYPLVDLEFTQAGSHELAARVRDGSLDLAFVATSDHLGRLTRVELGRRPLVLLLPPGHPLAVREAGREGGRDAGRAPGGQAEWADLRDQDFVDFHPSWAIRSLNDEALAAHGVTRRVRSTVDDVHTLLDLVHRGFGLALVPQHVAAKPQAAGLVTLALPASAPQWVVSAVTGGPAEASASLLLDLLDAGAAAAA